MPIILPKDDSAPRYGALRPATTSVYDVPVHRKIKSLRAPDGTLPRIEWTMLDEDGAPRDLTRLIAADGSLDVRMAVRESTGGGPVVPATAGAIDPTAGTVYADVDASVLGGPGIFLAEFGVYDRAGALRFVNRFFLDVEPSLFGGGAGLDSKALTIPEIRLHIRDSGRAENHLLDALQFDDAEIMACIRDPIDYWNSAVPQVGYGFTTQNFPYRWQWKEATIGRLYKIAAEWYRKNQLSYQAGGVAVDDLNKADAYDREGDRIWAAFAQWTTQIKVTLNTDQFWGVGRSPYGVISGWNVY